MGCAPSSPSLDAQAMLDKQREIMMQRQKEFEAKRQLQQTSPGTAVGARPSPVVTAKVNLPGTKTGSAPPSPATPLKRPETPKDREGLEETPRSRPTSKDMNKAGAIQEEKAQKKSSNTHDSGVKESEVKPELTSPGEPSAYADVETRARKYTVDQNDINARRSKNVHDFAMYAKDVTRRPSFNPRPKESPFTPEMQAMMKAGHEAMMAAEAENKQQTAASQEKAAAALPEFEDEEADENKGAKLNDAAEGEEPSLEMPPQETRVTKEPETFDLNVDEIRKKEEAEKTKSEAVPGLDDPNVSKFLARDNVDRKSKNVHDLGQYFNRRASFVPDAPGQRRASFLPQANGQPTRRASYLPPSSTPT